MQVAERINQLGGKPDFNPEGLASRARLRDTAKPTIWWR